MNNKQVSFKSRMALFLGDRQITDYDWDKQKTYDKVVITERQDKDGNITMACFNKFSGKKILKLYHVHDYNVYDNGIIVTITNDKPPFFSTAVYNFNGKDIIHFGQYEDCSIIARRFNYASTVLIIIDNHGKCTLHSAKTGIQLDPQKINLGNIRFYKNCLILIGKVNDDFKAAVYFGKERFTGFIYDVNIQRIDTSKLACAKEDGKKEYINLVTGKIEEN